MLFSTPTSSVAGICALIGIVDQHSTPDGATSLERFLRRVHAFMHPSMPQEPLVILHCALQHGAAASMNDILHFHQMQLAPPAISEFLHQCKNSNKSTYAAYERMSTAAAAFARG